MCCVTLIDFQSWAILASLKWSHFDYDGWTFWCVVELSLQILLGEFLHICSWGVWAYNNVLSRFYYHGNTGIIKSSECSFCFYLMALLLVLYKSGVIQQLVFWPGLYVVGKLLITALIRLLMVYLSCLCSFVLISVDHMCQTSPALNFPINWL